MVKNYYILTIPCDSIDDVEVSCHRVKTEDVDTFTSEDDYDSDDTHLFFSRKGLINFLKSVKDLKITDYETEDINETVKNGMFEIAENDIERDANED